VRPRCSSCGHEFTEHWYDVLASADATAGGCHVRRMIDASPCSCTGYVDAVLPDPGERLTFGVHRLSAAERDFTLPSEAERDAAFRKWAQGAIRDIALGEDNT
jgi:hypothetical protein